MNRLLMTHNRAEDNKNLPPSCPSRERLYELRDYLLGLNEEINEKFGDIIDVQRVNPNSRAYRGAGFRWFIILPWPSVSDEKLKDLKNFIRERIAHFEELTGIKTFGCLQTVAGGAMAYMIGLREKPINTDPPKPAS